MYKHITVICYMWVTSTLYLLHYGKRIAMNFSSLFTFYIAYIMVFNYLSSCGTFKIDTKIEQYFLTISFTYTKKIVMIVIMLLFT